MHLIAERYPPLRCCEPANGRRIGGKKESLVRLNGGKFPRASRTFSQGLREALRVD